MHELSLQCSVPAQKELRTFAACMRVDSVIAPCLSTTVWAHSTLFLLLFLGLSQQPRKMLLNVVCRMCTRLEGGLAIASSITLARSAKGERV